MSSCSDERRTDIERNDRHSGIRVAFLAAGSVIHHCWSSSKIAFGVLDRRHAVIDRHHRARHRQIDRHVGAREPPFTTAGRAPIGRRVDLSNTGAFMAASGWLRPSGTMPPPSGRRHSPHESGREPVTVHTFVTTMLDAGVDFCDEQIAARHADPRTTKGYDRSHQQPRPPPQLHDVNSLAGKRKRHAVALAAVEGAFVIDPVSLNL
jgi:hypothetical protein